MKSFRIGQIVPSSNTTMETEIPAMLRAREAIQPESFTFHSSRMRMKKATKEELEAMDADSDRCALELSDARVDVLGYACLVAIMSMGKGYHCTSQERLHQVTVDTNSWILVLDPDPSAQAALCGAMNSLVLDYCLRNSLSQPSIPQNVYEQLPVPRPSQLMSEPCVGHAPTR